MRSLQIPDVKDFMTKLLTTDIFDTFLVSEASVTTFTTFQIDGSYHPDYFGNMDGSADADHGKEETAPYWRLIRPFFFDLIKGKHTPLNFKIVFRLADYNVEKLLLQAGIPLHALDVSGLYLNIYYNGKEISCITGTSVRVFTLDKSLEHAWDDMVGKFLKQRSIPFLC